MKTDFDRAMVYSLGIAVLLLCSCDFNPVRQFRPGIDFYEGNNATQDLVCHLDIPPARPNGTPFDFTANSGCTNDEVRSLVLNDIDGGVKISLYDNSQCSTSDAATRIRVLNAVVGRKVVGTFESEVIDNDIHVELLRRGNLDGKVSCVIIDSSP